MVMTIESIRRWNTRALADSFGGVKGFSERIARAQPQVSHIIGRNPIKPIESRLARHIEEACGVEPGWPD